MRIKIKEDFRELLFSAVKDKLGRNWKQIRKDFGVPKSTFEKYKSGNLLLPEQLFLSLISILNIDDKEKIVQNSKKFPDNFGSIIGGKKAYVINFSKFQEGRKKGIKAIRKARNIETISFEDFLLSPQVCEFIGAFIGDGCFNCYKNKLYKIEFAGDKRFDVEYYKEIIIPVVKLIAPEVIPHIYYPKNNILRVVFYSKKLFYFLRDYCEFVPGKKTFTVLIPPKIINLIGENNHLVFSTIRGIFDTDGCVFLDKRKSYRQLYPRISLQVVSKPLYFQLKDLLAKEFKLYATYNQKRQVYIMEIYTINQFKKWMSLIGFSNRRHLNRLAPVAQLVGARHW